MFTIKSESEEGFYYLCNHWYKNKRFWIKEKDLHSLSSDCLFATPALAKRSLKHLLEVMRDEYIDDKFSMVEIINGNIIGGISFIAKDERKGYWDKPEISFCYEE